MEVFTVKEWEENFDSLLERVENGSILELQEKMALLLL